MNIIILTGRLTRDPELKTGQSGKAYARFTLAVERPMQKDETDFINCVAFGKTAELIGEYLRKGRKAGVTGRLQMEKYEVNGEKRTSYDVIVDTIEFLESKNTVNSTEETTQQNRSTQSSNTSKPVGKKSEEVPYEDDDEFPF